MTYEWKRSADSRLLHGVQGIEDHQYSTTSFMEKNAESKEVRLEYSEQDGRLMLLQVT